VVTRTTVFRRIIPACILAVILIFNVVLVLFLTHYKEERINVRDAEHFVTLGELYNNPENVQELYNMLAGEEGTVYQQIYALAKSVQTSNSIRKKTYHKTSDQNLIVTLGGLEWQVCYLSLTGDEGDAERTPILTLMLSDAQTLSKFQTWGVTDTDLTYPCNMYGTSYVRAVTLNNGGEYAVNADTLKSVNQNSRNQFAIFTMDGINGSVTDAIVKPVDVKWQETQSAVTSAVSESNYNNEAWGIPSSNTSAEFSAIDYAGQVGNDAWKNDYLWLPSYTEIGKKDQKGLWRIENKQRRCGYTYWLRSVPQSVYSYGALQIDKTGSLGFQPVHDGGFYVLPALHLNLGALSMRASSALVNA